MGGGVEVDPDSGSGKESRGRVVTKKKETFAEVLKEMGYSSPEEFRKAVRNIEAITEKEQDRARIRREAAKMETEEGIRAARELAKRFPQLDRKKE